MLRSKSRGFTLIEMMITLAIMVIGVTMAIPAFQGLIASQRLAAGANEMVTMLNYGRMEAVRQRGRVVVCPSSNGSACAANNQWSRAILFFDANRDGARATTEPVLRQWDFSNRNLTLTQLTGTSSGKIVFGGSGLSLPSATGAAMTSVRICAKGLTTRSNTVLVQTGGAHTVRGNGNGCL